MAFRSDRRRWLQRGLSVFAFSCIGLGSIASQAATLWYNGDYNNNDAATNVTNVRINLGGSYQFLTSYAFNNFTVPTGQTWTLTGVFSNNQIAFHATAPSATWQIRTGMSAGNGGTLVSSGSGTATLTQLNAADYIKYIDPEVQVSVAVPNIVLTAGTYWVAVAPSSQGYNGDQSYLETTSGANATGTPAGNDGNSYLFNSLSGPGSLNYVASSLDYSEGVIGTTATPEPASALSLSGLVGVLCLGGCRRRIRSAGSEPAATSAVTVQTELL